MWCNAAGFAWIDRALLFATSRDAIFLHHPFDPVLPCLEQSRYFPMSHRIILLMPLFNRRGDLFILLRLFAFEIESSSCDLQCSGHLAFGVGAVRPTQLMRQFHPSRVVFISSAAPRLFLGFRSARSIRQ